MNYLYRTFFAIVALCFSLYAGAQDLFGRMAMEGVDIVGAITYGKYDSYTTLEPGYYSFNYETSYQAHRTNCLLSATVAGGCCYHDGKVYACEYDDGAHLTEQRPMWRIYDGKTLEELDAYELEDGCVSTTKSLTYDPTTDKIYGINRSYSETYLVCIDPATGTPTKVGESFDSKYRYAALGCDKTGKLYILYMEQVNDEVGVQQDVWYLAKVRKSDGKFAKVGEIKMEGLLDGDSYINDTRAQALFCNYNTGKMYWIFGSSSMTLYSEYSCIAELETTTATATLKAYTSKLVLVSGAFFREPLDKAPGVISDFSFIPDAEGSTNGKLQFTPPSTAYDGTTLDSPVTVTVAEGSDTLVNAVCEPGVPYTSDELELENGAYTVSVTASGDGGEGPTVTRKFFVGYDLPTACTNITLTADSLTTTLTWDAPTIGQNGAPLNKENLTYTVVRYPYEVTVATGLKECRFEETHPSDMTRYVYLVTANDGEKVGKSAYSNNLIVGTPLDVPYGGAWTGPADMINYYTIIDANKDNNSWKYDATKNSAIYGYSTTEDADDWLISPPINYQKDHTYILSFEAHSAMLDYPETMEVCFGNARTPQAMDSLMLYIEEVPVPLTSDSKNMYSLEFTVPADGVYYYGFHCMTPKYHGNLFLSEVSVTDKDAPSGISDLSVDGHLPYSLSGGVLTADGTQEVNVYDLGGHTVCAPLKTTGHVALPKGVYVVKAGHTAHKVVVK